MKISPDNPHLNTLRKSLKDEGLLSGNTSYINERATILGMSVVDYEELRKDFPYLDEGELESVMSSIIAWYQAKEAIRRIAGKI